MLDAADAAKKDLNYPVEIFSIRFGDSDSTDISLMHASCLGRFKAGPWACRGR